MTITAQEIIDRIKSICEIKDLENIGISAQVISNWKSRNSIPKADDLYKISLYLHCTMEYLLTGKDFENKLPDDELELLTNYRLLDDHDKHSMLLMIEALTGK